MIILEVLIEPRLTQADGGAYPRGGRLRQKLLLVQALLVWIEWFVLVLIIAGRKKTSVE